MAWLGKILGAAKLVLQVLPLVDSWISRIMQAYRDYQARKKAEAIERAAKEATDSKDSSRLEDELNGKK